jgi:hypothetical protein
LEAKWNNYNTQFLRSNNKIKTTWEIVKEDSGKKINKNNNINIQGINVDGDSTDNPQVIASVFNEHFLSVAEKTLPQHNAAAVAAANNNPIQFNSIRVYLCANLTAQRPIKKLAWVHRNTQK